MQQRNFLFNLDWFDENFMAKFVFKKTPNKTYLNAKSYRISDENISTRVLNHWEDIGLIDDNRPQAKGWRKYSIMDIVWFLIIKKLRTFGVELEKIKEVKKYIEIYAHKDEISKFPELEFYMLYGHFTSTPVKLLVFTSGQALIGRQVDIDLAKQFGGINEDYISIDLNDLFNSCFSKSKRNTDYLDYGLSNIEREIRDSIIPEDLESITIKLGSGDEYLLTKNYILQSKNEMSLLLGRLSHADATESKRGGKTIFKVSELKKIKKD